MPVKKKQSAVKKPQLKPQLVEDVAASQPEESMDETVVHFDFATKYDGDYAPPVKMAPLDEFASMETMSVGPDLFSMAAQAILTGFAAAIGMAFVLLAARVI
ncbi:MAG: hypothetical protein EPN91_07285 [Salinibacterium sp.]|nr:MAG: hypothetical protein EPN91_07285 [Salinibacterium sp.]